MAQIGGQWVNHYGPMADFVVTVVGSSTGDEYRLEADYRGPGISISEPIGSVEDTADSGETNFHVFPTELEATANPKYHEFVAELQGNRIRQEVSGVMPPTLAVPSQIGFPDDVNPLPDLQTPMPPGTDVDTRVILARSMGREIEGARVDYIPHLLSGQIGWYSSPRDGVGSKTEIGGGNFKFLIDWGVVDEFQLGPDIPNSTTAMTAFTTPETIGDYEFCVETDVVSYYIPDDSEWHTPIHRL
jgi:hypothetical protein